MSRILLPITTALFVLAVLFYRRNRARLRLANLTELMSEPEESEFVSEKDELTVLSSALSRAGLFKWESRAVFVTLCVLLLSALAASGYLLAPLENPLGQIFGAIGGAYLGITLCFLLLKKLQKRAEQAALYEMPFFLESVSLLVESGLGVLPAIEKVLARSETVDKPVSYAFDLAHRLSSRGLTLRRAFELVAEASPYRIVRHVLLHLDISSSEGGELLPALRALSDFAQAEWKLAVEQRVRRLENLVIFPVFVEVMGLVLLCAAVPLVPLLELSENLSNGRNLQRVLEERKQSMAGNMLGSIVGRSVPGSPDTPGRESRSGKKQ